MQKSKPSIVILICTACLLFASVSQAGQDQVEKQRDYLAIVKAYADAMINDGRDTYGAKHSPLFASALNRRTMQIGGFDDITGVRKGDRTVGGSNPQVDSDLYAILYRLTELSGDKKYANQADQALEAFDQLSVQGG